ncbi:hypothetical protein BDY24DRAFT_385623 [Mrakia frigida]|uniref:uncharacterized protein n=1 Tax=Mrakia frigida TaxID=29902 RepID=UPI003FCBF255
MPSTSSSPSSSPARTTFFSNSFPSLHDLVMDHLSESDSRHLLLPLLALNRYWRGIARDYLLRPFKNAKYLIQEDEGSEDEEESPQDKPLWEGEYIKVLSSLLEPLKSAPSSLTLTRFLLHRSSSQSTALKTVLCQSPIHENTSPTHLPSSTTSTRMETESDLTFRSKSCDPLTDICTFVPSLPPSDEDKEDDEDDDTLNPSSLLPFPCLYHTKSRLPFSDPEFINVLPSTWFVPGKEEGSGLEVACDRDAFPDCFPFDTLTIPKKAGGFEKKVSEGWKDSKAWRDDGDGVDPFSRPEEFMRPGWKLQYGVLRGDKENDDPSTLEQAFPGTYYGPTAAVIFSLEIPLVHLFRPPGLRNESWFF